MLDINARLANLKRPPLLVRAVRFGVDDYRREVHLKQFLHVDKMPKPAEAIMQLLDLEAEVDLLRRANSGNYTIATHIELLIAIIGETRLMRSTRPSPM